ncbi:unnamed protein product [Camellia sinensis]
MKVLGVSLPIPTLLTLFLLLLIQPPFTAAHKTTSISLITETCNRTKFPQICISTLEADNRSFTANLSSLCGIATQQSAAKANLTLSKVTELLKNSTEYGIWESLQVCQYVYNQSNYRIANEGVPAIHRGDFKTAHQMVGLVNKAASDCNQTRLEILSQANTLLFRLTVDTMAMLHLLF